MSLYSPADLTARWREEAKRIRRFAGDGAANAFETAADELDFWWAEQSDRLLSIKEAAILVGRHRDTISGALSSGRLTNHGQRNRPRVRYGELISIYPSSTDSAKMGSGYNKTTDARAFLGARRGDSE